MTGLAPRCGKPITPYERRTAIPDKYATGLGDAIRQARHRLGWTQEQLAAELGISGRYARNAISAWENDRRYPQKAAARLEEILGIKLGGPVCGRRAGHGGFCVSQAAWRRRLGADVRRKAAA